MTWSIAHEMNFTGATSSAADLHDAGGPLQYHFETFLPAHGWTVTAEGESGGLTVNAEERWYGISKVCTYADGRTQTVNFLVEIEYSGEDIHIYSWDGTPGSGGGSVLTNITSSVPIPSTSLSTSNWKWLASDEDDDAWFLMVDNEISGGSLPYSQNISDPSLGHIYAPVHTNGNFKFLTNSVVYFSSGYYFDSVVRVLNPNFAIQVNSNGGLTAFNQLTDIMLKHNVTNSSITALDASFTASLLIGSDYWLDFSPNLPISLLIKTGATDLGVF